jgi:hypothetical protein
MRVVYTGPHAEVEVPSLGVVAVRGEAVEVDDAAGHELVKQGDWNAAKPATVKKAEG